MIYKRLLLSIILLLFLSPATTFAQDRSITSTIHPVGMAVSTFHDTSRMNWQGTASRPLETVLWYPAEKTANEDTVFVGPPNQPLFIAGMAARETEISSALPKYPLVLLSHGTGGSALQMMWLGSYLAARGYIVAAVNHHGNTAAEKELSPAGFVLWCERSEDISTVLAKLLTASFLGSHINKGQIGAAGFSLGGYTVISLAGGLTNRKAFNAFCNSGVHPACQPPPEYPALLKDFKQIKDNSSVQASLRHSNDSYRDKRIEAVFALAPALGGAFTDAGLTPIDIPAYIIAGRSDTIAPISTNAMRSAKGIK